MSPSVPDPDPAPVPGSSIPAALLAALALACAPTALAPRTAHRPTATLTIATYNVDLHRSGDRETLAAIAATDADVVCLQETGRAWEPPIRRALAHRYPHILFHHGGRQTTSGLAVLSRHPIDEPALLDNRTGWHPAWSVLAHTPAGPVQLLVVHLRPPFGKRAGALGFVTTASDHRAEIDRFASVLRDDVPAIVAGDFNEEQGGAALAHLAGRGFRSVLPMFRPGEPTWRHPTSPLPLAAAIDHVVVGPRIVPLDARVLDRGRSDHRPVVVTVELPDSRRPR